MKDTIIITLIIAAVLINIAAIVSNPLLGIISLIGTGILTEQLLNKIGE